MATGGYGRREVCPFSDIDLTICYLPGVRGIKEVSSAILYPLWDSGLKVGHSVRTPKEAVGVASAETDVATSHLDTRYVAGSKAAFEELSARLSSFFKKKTARLVEAVVQARNRRLGSLEEFDGIGLRAGSLHADLKLGSGGLRDISSLEWVAALSGVRLDEVLSEADYASLNRAKSDLLLLRSALHLCYGRQHDQIDHSALIRLEERFGADLGEELVGKALSSMVTAEYVVEQGLRALLSPPAMVRGRADSGGVIGRPSGDHGGGSGTDPVSATRGLSPEAASELLMERIRGPQEGLLEDLLAMQAKGVLQAAIPEWRFLEGLYQRDPYHLFTVDVHSIATTARVGYALDRALLDSPEPWPASLAAELRELAHGSRAPDERSTELRLACLLHDIGKGLTRQPRVGERSRHAEVGSPIARTIAERLGLSVESAMRCETLVRHHLLLAQMASGRDAGDEATLGTVVSIVGHESLLDQLYLLTLADSSATGPQAWNAWRRSLLTRLYLATRRAFEATASGEAGGEGSPEAELRRRLLSALRGAGMDGTTAARVAAAAPKQLLWLEDADTSLVASALCRLLGRQKRPVLEGRALGDGYYSLVIAAMDAPGLFAKVAGALAVCGLSVVSAQASTLELDPPVACDQFHVSDVTLGSSGTADLGSMESRLRSALAGRLSLSYRLALKTKEWKEHLELRYRRSGVSPPQPSEEPEVRILNDVSAHATVVEIRAPNRPRLLYDVASVLAELCLDIKSAKISTMSGTAADVFYITDLEGNKVVDPDYLREVRAALTHTLRAGL